jgi:hypothetical protein
MPLLGSIAARLAAEWRHGRAGHVPRLSWRRAPVPIVLGGVGGSCCPHSPAVAQPVHCAQSRTSMGNLRLVALRVVGTAGCRLGDGQRLRGRGGSQEHSGGQQGLRGPGCSA